jgi:hypothetical protein
MDANEQLPTRSAEALRSFVKGQDSFQAYWGSRALSDLEHARDHFGEAERSDPAFALATFYAAIAENELRQHDSAIARLNALADRGVDFLPETYLHLAYAYTKKYTDDDYARAEGALDQSEREARVRDRQKLIPVLQSYRVFLYSVIGGRSKRPDRGRYLDEAIKRGEALLADPSVARLESRDAVLLEVQNALGIAYMRRGEAAQDPEDKRRFWAQANSAYERALEINPNVVRVLHNVGTLRKLQADFVRATDTNAAAALDREALAIFRRTLAMNPHDQFPHYRAAVLSATLGDWDAADKYYTSGQNVPGSVKAEEWNRLRAAIDAKDAARLRN